MLAQRRRDYDEAARQYQRSLEINERLGNQAGLATGYSQMAVLARNRGGSAGQPMALHMRAPAIRLHLGVPTLSLICAASRRTDASWVTTR
jgi:hypothetical protein